MNIETLQQFRESDLYTQVMQRSRSRNDNVLPLVRTIMNDVRLNGDEALRRLTREYDGVEVQNLRVPQSAMKVAVADMDADFMASLEQARINITAVHQDQLPVNESKPTQPVPGVEVWRKWQPIETVGVYVPGGMAVYPSSVLMNVIPAQIAGCKRIVIVTPPNDQGEVSTYVLAVAQTLGIEEVYAVGGAQAIAALAYGTDMVPKVDKIVGPGNAYVAAAKLLALNTGEVAIDSPAGPSEVLVLADETARSDFVAADLICDTEHGDDSAGVLVTTSRELAEQVVVDIERLLQDLPTADRVRKSLDVFGACIVVDTVDEAVVFANEYAAEHTLVQTADARLVAEQITNAGSVFVGPYACKSAGDYATGSNHVLPTSGGARMFSALSVYDFVKLVEYQSVSEEGLVQLRSTIETFAKVEGLPGHALSSSIRFTH